VWSKGGIKQAVKSAKAVGGFAVRIEVECRSEDEGREAIEAGADIVMLDNVTFPRSRRALDVTDTQLQSSRLPGSDLRPQI